MTNVMRGVVLPQKNGLIGRFFDSMDSRVMQIERLEDIMSISTATKE